VWYDEKSKKVNMLEQILINQKGKSLISFLADFK
jgi:hypothetical protein